MRSITSGPNKDMGNPFEAREAAHEALYQGLVDEFYSRFRGLVESRRGGIPPGSLEAATDGRIMTGVRALEWGLVSEVVSASMLWQRGQQIAEKMLQLPAAALRETKRLIHLDEGYQPKVAYRADTEAYLRCLELPDAQEGLVAFAEKRPPQFRGD